MINKAAAGRPRWTRTLARRSAPMRVVVAGALSGFIAAGIGSRVVMRVIALYNDDRRGVMTDGSAIVGEFTRSGTISLLLLGTVAGVIGGILYLGLRRWLFAHPVARGLAFGVITLLTIGQIVFDTHNVDFQIFEPVPVVVALFASLFLINGLLIVTIADRVHPEPAYPPGTRMPRAVAGVIAAACLLGAMVMAGTVSTMVADAGTCFAAIGGGEGCAVYDTDVVR